MFIQNRIQKLLNNTRVTDVCCIVSDFESSTDPATNLIVAGSVGCSLGKGGIFVWHGCRPPRGPLSRRDGSREKKGAVATWATRHFRCASKYPVCPSARGQPLSETLRREDHAVWERCCTAIYAPAYYTWKNTTGYARGFELLFMM